MTKRPPVASAWLLVALSVVAFAAAASSESSVGSGDGERNITASADAAPAAPANPTATPAAADSAAPSADVSGVTVGVAPPAAYSGASDNAASSSGPTGVAVPPPPGYSGAADSAAASSAAVGVAAPTPPAYDSPRALSGRSISSAPPANSADAGQFHIQTDEGPERYFRYQTQSGQYRKEKRLQDGSVVGSYGWIGADGVLRLRDYVADNSGYRVVRTKSVYVGRDEPIGSALAKSKSAPSQGGSGYRAHVATAPPTPPPLPLSTPQQQQQQEPIRRPALGYSPPSFSFSPPASVVYPGYQPIASNALQPQYSGLPSNYQYQTVSPPASDRYDPAAAGFYHNSVQPPQQQQFPLYDGIATTQNGFRYYLPRQYQEEETLSEDRRAGSFGYIDPFGIRRVIYYNTAPGTGFVHRKNNRYVGFDATPYDPRF